VHCVAASSLCLLLVLCVCSRSPSNCSRTRHGKAAHARGTHANIHNTQRMPALSATLLTRPLASIVCRRAWRTRCHSLKDSKRSGSLSWSRTKHKPKRWSRNSRNKAAGVAVAGQQHRRGSVWSPAPSVSSASPSTLLLRVPCARALTVRPSCARVRVHLQCVDR